MQMPNSLSYATFVLEFIIWAQHLFIIAEQNKHGIKPRIPATPDHIMVIMAQESAFADSITGTWSRGISNILKG